MEEIMTMQFYRNYSGDVHSTKIKLRYDPCSMPYCRTQHHNAYLARNFIREVTLSTFIVTGRIL